MDIVDLPLAQLKEAPWNANETDPAMLGRLRESIRRFGLIQNLVVRPLGDGSYEVLSGNQRLKILKEAVLPSAPCVVVHLDDARARLLAEALNRIHGEDNLGLRAELIREVLEGLTENDLVAVLPETANSLKALASLGQETIAEYLQKWQQAQPARLRHLQFQLTAAQLEVVQEALARVTPQAVRAGRNNPNLRGNALYLLCREYLQKEATHGQ